MSAARFEMVRRRGEASGSRGLGMRAEGGGDASLTRFSMAFQPVVDVLERRTVGYEALVRGVTGESAATVLGLVPEGERYVFDETCRVVAIEKAAQLGLVGNGADLMINFYPNAVSEGCLEETLRTAAAVGLPLRRMVFEISEMERLRDPEQLKTMLEPYRMAGLRTAIDDFGAGFAGLTLLAAFQPDVVKIDLALVDGIDERPASRAIVRGVKQMCAEMGIVLVAEGVERREQMEVLRDLGICYMQGNLFAPAAFEALPVWSG